MSRRKTGPGEVSSGPARFARPHLRSLGPPLLALTLVLTPALAGCGSSSTRSSTPSTTGPAPTTAASAPTSAAPTTVAGQMPTVYDCGGGAYEPATLLVVCGVGTTHVTGVHWTSWTQSSAAGTGTVLLPGKSPAPAALALSDVVSSGNGPEFASLRVTWTGTSPDGHPVDIFPLATAPAR